MAARKKPVGESSALDLARAQSAQSLTLARGLIGKLTKQKPLTASYGQHPFAPSGSIIVDNLIGGNLAEDGNPICPGFPRRRISEIFGPEASGKTTLALSAVAAVQKAGGSALFLDFEHAIDYRYAKTIGVSFNEDQMLVYAPDSLEDGFKVMFAAMASGIDIVVVDSVAAMTPADELGKSLSDPARVGAVASKMAQILPKVTNWLATLPKDKPEHKGTALVLLNQERASISTGGGKAPPEANSSGGKALKFYCSVRLRTQRFKTEKVDRKDPITGKVKPVPYGIVTGVKVVKDKLDGKAGQVGEIFIRYGFGVDDYFSVIEAGVANGIMRRNGASYEFDQVKIVGRDKFRQFLLTNEAVYKQLRDKVLAAILTGAKPVADEEISEEDRLLAQYESGGAPDDEEAVEDNPEDVSIEDPLGDD